MATHEVEKKKQAAKRNEYNVELKFQKLELNCDRKRRRTFKIRTGQKELSLCK